jgi:hypothetical protein
MKLNLQIAAARHEICREHPRQKIELSALDIDLYEVHIVQRQLSPHGGYIAYSACNGIAAAIKNAGTLAALVDKQVRIACTQPVVEDPDFWAFRESRTQDRNVLRDRLKNHDPGIKSFHQLRSPVTLESADIQDHAFTRERIVEPVATVAMGQPPSKPRNTLCDSSYRVAKWIDSVCRHLASPASRKVLTNLEHQPPSDPA